MSSAPSEVPGFFAALVAPLFGVVGLTLWDKHWTSNVGGHAFMLNAFKCSVCTILFLAVISAQVAHEGLEAAEERWRAADLHKVLLSSLLGIVIGDCLWLEALKLIQSRSVILIDCCKPFMMALLAWLPLPAGLGEELTWIWAVGFTITMGGVYWVEAVALPPAPPPEPAAAEPAAISSSGVELGEQPLRRDDSAGGAAAPADAGVDRRARSRRRKGFAYACLNVLLDQYSAIMTKQAATPLSSWEINFVRFGGAAATLVLLICLRRIWLAAAGSPVRQGAWYAFPALSRSSLRWVLFGTLSTTFLQPLMTAWALFQIKAAIYGTLTATGPIWSLPVARLIKGERTTKWRVCGAAVAVAGVVVLAEPWR